MACPPETPYLCKKKTLQRGLCVKERSECGVRVSRKRSVPAGAGASELGARYGYAEADLGRSCYLDAAAVAANTDYDIRYEGGEPVPASFSFLTYNIWGLAKKEVNKHLFGLRKNLLVGTILAADADLCFLQEMSQFAYGELEVPLIGHYPYASERPFPAAGTPTPAERRRQVEVYCLSKYQPSRIRMIGIEGVLGYKNSVMIVEYPNLVVFNLYSQAGSRSSPGQEQKWLHYSRCRFDILETIHDIMVRDYHGARMVLCGDFNFDLDGSRANWPEVAMLRKIKRLGFVDTFPHVNSSDPGYTEDTTNNVMRWNQKLIEKHYRFDAVLAKGLRPTESRLIGTESEELSPADSDWFIEKISECAGDRSRLRGYDVATGRLQINPSDHYGVLTTFAPGSASASSSSSSRKRSSGGSRRTRKLSYRK